MTEDDVKFVSKIMRLGLVQSPCLELGCGYKEGVALKDLLIKAGIEHVGSDMIGGPKVDYVVNFENNDITIERSFPGRPCFGTALALNVLEHTFEPIKVLDNVLSILRPGGSCVIVTPAVWPIHDYPKDCCRLLPNFYQEYCKSRKLRLLGDCFEYVGKGKISEFCEKGNLRFPPPSTSKFSEMKSRIIHKLFNTTGKQALFPSHVAIGCVIEKPGGIAT